MNLYSKLQRRLATLVIGTFLVTSTYSPLLASDYKDHWAKDAIEKWKDKGVVDGYEDGTFKPKQAITRAELAKIIVEIFGLNNTSRAIKYSDIADDAWYTPYIAAVSSSSIMNDNNDKFNPNSYATREEAAYAIAMAYKVANGNSEFKDSEEISEWAVEKVGALAANGYVNGRNDGKFAPKDSLTRADVITMIDKITADLVNKSGTYSKDIKGNLVVNTGDVILKDMLVDGNLYIAEGVGEGDVTLDNVKVNGKVFLEGAGENSFKCVNGSKLNEVEVNKASNKPVRIYQDKSCSIEKVDTLSDCIIDGKGAFNEVNVESSCNVEVKQATVRTLNIRVESTIKTSSGAIIGTLTCDAVVTVTGNGTIENCSVNIVGCKLSVAPKNTFFIDANIKVSIGSKEYGKNNINDAAKDTQSNNSSSNNSSVSNNNNSSTNSNNTSSNNIPSNNNQTTTSGAINQEDNNFEYNKDRLISFYKKYGIEIPNKDDKWNFWLTTGSGSYGEPDEWDNEGIIFVAKHGMKDSIPYEQYRYGYCPKLDEGVLIISENHYSKIIKYYKNGEVISKGELPNFEDDDLSNQEDNNFEYNKNRLISFYKKYGIEIPNKDDKWNFWLTTGSGSYGEPDEWDNEGIIFVAKHGMKDSIPYEQYRYGYCPKLDEGVLIISENHYSKIIKYYKNGEVIETTDNNKPTLPQNNTTTDSNYKSLPPQNSTITSATISVNPNQDIYYNDVYIGNDNGTYTAKNNDGYNNKEDVTSIFKDIKFNVINNKIVIDIGIKIDLN